MRYLLNYLKPHTKRLILEFVIKFLGTIMDLLLPMLLSVVINNASATHDRTQVFFWGGLMILCSLLCYFLNVTANRMSTAVSRECTKALRHDLFHKVEHLSCHQADQLTSPTLVSRMTTDTYNVHQLIDRMQRLGVRAPILLIGGILSTLMLDRVLTLALVVILPILTVIVMTISRRGVPLYNQVQSTLDTLVRKVQENMSGVRVIKALDKSDAEKVAFEKINDTLASRDQTASVTMALSNPLINFILNAGLTLVVVLGAYRVQAGLTQPGTIIAFLNYFIIILNAVLSVTRLFMIYSKGSASARRIGEIFNAPDENTLLHLMTPRDDSVLSMEHVSFSYNKHRDNLTDVSFSLKKGETLGIIGATGSGKSTVLSLLLRLYDVDQGIVRVMGQDIRTIPCDELYQHFGVVFQNDFLFADTLRENIRFGRDLTEDQIKSAVLRAQADFVFSDPDGLDAKLDIKGHNRSGGQRQRILIARALASAPDILLLDDCSSALDYATDAALRHALRESLPDSVKVIVSQRVSAIRDATKIIVLDDGRVIGQGTHDELVISCPIYRDIYMTQMGQEA